MYKLSTWFECPWTHKCTAAAVPFYPLQVQQLLLVKCSRLLHVSYASMTLVAAKSKLCAHKGIWLQWCFKHHEMKLLRYADLEFVWAPSRAGKITLASQARSTQAPTWEGLRFWALAEPCGAESMHEMMKDAGNSNQIVKVGETSSKLVSTPF